MFRCFVGSLLHLYVFFKVCSRFLKFSEVLKALKNDPGWGGWLFVGKEALLASATPHGGLLGIPSNFHYAPNYKDEDFSIFWK